MKIKSWSFVDITVCKPRKPCRQMPSTAPDCFMLFHSKRTAARMPMATAPWRHVPRCTTASTILKLLPASNPAPIRGNAAAQYALGIMYCWGWRCATLRAGVLLVPKGSSRPWQRGCDRGPIAIWDTDPACGGQQSAISIRIYRALGRSNAAQRLLRPASSLVSVCNDRAPRHRLDCACWAASLEANCTVSRKPL